MGLLLKSLFSFGDFGDSRKAPQAKKKNPEEIGPALPYLACVSWHASDGTCLPGV